MPQAVVEVIKAGLDSQDSEVRFEAAELALSYPLRPPRRSRTIGPVASQRWADPDGSQRRPDCHGPRATAAH